MALQAGMILTLPKQQVEFPASGSPASLGSDITERATRSRPVLSQNLRQSQFSILHPIIPVYALHCCNITSLSPETVKRSYISQVQFLVSLLQ